MSVYNLFLVYFDCAWCLDECLAGWPLATHLAFSESKMASKMAAAPDQNLDFIITLVLSTVQWWCWHLYLCLWGLGIQFWSSFNILWPFWWHKSKMAAKITINCSSQKCTSTMSASPMMRCDNSVFKGKLLAGIRDATLGGLVQIIIDNFDAVIKTASSNVIIWQCWWCSGRQIWTA